MAALRLPFEGKNMPQLIMNIVTKEPLELPEDRSEEMKFLVKSMLQKKPKSRPSVAQVLATPFVQKHCNLMLEKMRENALKARQAAVTKFKKERNGSLSTQDAGELGIPNLSKHDYNIFQVLN